MDSLLLFRICRRIELVRTVAREDLVQKPGSLVVRVARRALFCEQTPVNVHIPGKGRRSSRRSPKCGLNTSSIAPRHASNKRSEPHLQRVNSSRQSMSSPTSPARARAQGPESDSEGRGAPRRTGNPWWPPIRPSHFTRLRNAQTSPPTRDSPLSRSPRPKGMPERSAPAIHFERGTVSTSKDNYAYKIEHSHDRKRLPRRPGGRPGRPSSALSSAHLLQQNETVRYL